MKVLASMLALLLATPAFAAPYKKKILTENADLIVTVSVAGGGAPLTLKSRVQAQSQFSAAQDVKNKNPRKLTFSGVPVINPNNGKARMEFKGSASWGTDVSADFGSAIEVELGQETLVYDSEGVTVKIKIAAAD